MKRHAIVAATKEHRFHVGVYEPDEFDLPHLVESFDVHEQVERLIERRVSDKRVYAVGPSADACIIALAKEMKWGDVTIGEDLVNGDEARFTWGKRFTAGGTSFKAAGGELPGGFTLTWWK